MNMDGKVRRLLSGRRVRGRIITRFFNHHRNGKKNDILILASPRSGSTWLMEILYTQPGMKYINEPLVKSELDCFHLLPINTRWNYLSLEPYEQQILRNYFQEDKKIKRFGPINIFDPNYNFFTNRRVFKVIRANSLIEWFSEELSLNIIYLVRHPISQSLSCMNRGHHCEIEEYLNDIQFSKKYLDKKLIDFIREVLQSGSTFEKFITEWCLDNIVPLNTKENYKFLTITYEEIVMNPEAIIELLYDNLDLNDKAAMLSKIQTPSMVTDSSTKETVDHIKKGDKVFLLDKWRKYISECEEKIAFEILDRFGIKIYQIGSSLPNKEMLNFRHERGH